MPSPAETEKKRPGLRIKGKAIWLTLLLSVLACGRPSEPSGYLRLRLAEDPTTLDPARVVDVAGGSLAAKIYNGLVRFDVDGRVIPDLADSWELLPDGVTWRFLLRPDAVFADGTPVMPADVIFSLSRLLDPAVNSPRSWLLEDLSGAADFQAGKAKTVKGLRSPEPGVVELECSRPQPLLPCLLAMPNAAVLPRGPVREKGDDFFRLPLGSGPFRLEKWERGAELSLSANRNYFRGRPGLAGIIYRVIPEELTAAVEFEQGNLDIIEVPRAGFRKYTTEKPWRDRIVSRTGLNTYYVGMNCERPPFDRPPVRQALNWAIDREAICRRLLEGRAEPALGPVPPVLLDDPELGGYGYDPSRARKLIEDSGLELPLRVRLLVSAERQNVSIAEVLQDYWRKIGVETEIVQMEWSAFKQEIVEGDFDLFYLSWWGDYPSPENFLYPTFFSANLGPGGNRSRFSDPGVDLLLREAAGRADETGRRDLYRRAQRAVVELAPWVFLWHKKQYLALGPEVSGYVIPLVYSADNLEKVTVAREER